MASKLRAAGEEWNTGHVVDKQDVNHSATTLPRVRSSERPSPCWHSPTSSFSFLNNGLRIWQASGYPLLLLLQPRPKLFILSPRSWLSRGSKHCLASQIAFLYQPLKPYFMEYSGAPANTEVVVVLVPCLFKKRLIAFVECCLKGIPR